MLSLIIVDDEKLIREGLVTYIDWSSLGIRIGGVCATAQEGLALVRDAGADIVLTDIRMPGMDGIELLKRLKDIDPRCVVVFVSAYRNFEYARKALHFGAFDYVLKPIEETALYETFRRCAGYIAERAVGEHDPGLPEATAIDELRLYLQAGLHDPELWSRIVAGLRVPAEGVRSLYILRPTPPDAITEAGREGDEVLRELRSDGAAVRSVRLDAGETVVIAFGGPGPGGSAPTTEGELAKLSALMVGWSRGSADRDPTELYLEASWAIVAITSVPGRRVMSYGELRATLARRPPPPATPPLLAAQIMAADGPDHEALTWHLFSGLARAGHALDPNVVRLEVSRTVEGAVTRLAEYPALKPALSATDGIGQLIAHERSLLDMYRVTREYLGRLISIVRQRLSPRISRRINDAINFVRDDLTSDISLAGVARRLLVSPGYLSRAFSREMSESFSHFRSRMRVERAKQLLLDHRHKVYEVAGLVGFNDVTHFIKVFVKFTGVPPSEYRKRRGETGDTARA